MTFADTLRIGAVILILWGLYLLESSKSAPLRVLGLVLLAILLLDLERWIGPFQAAIGKLQGGIQAVTTGGG